MITRCDNRHSRRKRHHREERTGERREEKGEERGKKESEQKMRCGRRGSGKYFHMAGGMPYKVQVRPGVRHKIIRAQAAGINMIISYMYCTVLCIVY